MMFRNLVKKNITLEPVSVFVDRFINIVFSIIVILVPLIQDIINPEIRPRDINNNIALVLFINCVTALAALSVTKIVLKKTPLVLKIKITDIIVIAGLVFIVANRWRISNTMFSSFNFLLIPYFAVLYFFCRLRNSPLLILRSIVLSGAVQATYAWLQFFDVTQSHHVLFKMTGAFANPGILGQYLAISVVVIVALLSIYSDRIAQFFSGSNQAQKMNNPKSFSIRLVTGFILIAFLLTQSRGAYLGAVLTLVIFSYPNMKNIFWNRRPEYFKILMAAVISIVIVSAIGGLYYFKKDSADGRLLIWKVSGKMIAEKPILGLGFDNIQSGIMDQQAKYFIEKRPEGEVRITGQIAGCFNEFIQLTVENGVVGLVLALMMLAKLFGVKGSDENKITLKLFKMILVCFLIGAFFSYPGQILALKIIFVIASGAIVNMDRNYIYEFNIGRGYDNLKKALISSAGIFVIIFSFGIGMKLSRCLSSWDSAYLAFRLGDYQQALDGYNLVYKDLCQNGLFLSDYGTALLLAEEYTHAAKILEASVPYCNNANTQMNLGVVNYYLEKFAYSESSFAKASKMLPNRLLPKYRLAILYIKTKQLAKAQKTAISILKQPVKVQSKITDSIRKSMRIFLDLHK